MARCYLEEHVRTSRTRAVWSRLQCISDEPSAALRRQASFIRRLNLMPWTVVVEDIQSIVSRYPHRELDIRRLCARSPSFRAVCRDYEQAAAAHRHWRNVESETGSRAQDYANFLRELEAEILSQLDGSIAGTNRAESAVGNE